MMVLKKCFILQVFGSWESLVQLLFSQVQEIRVEIISKSGLMLY